MRAYLIWCILIFVVFFFNPLSTQAQGIQNIGVPYVQNYSKSDYLAGNQNWSISRDENGLMFFGNTDGLLSFDGSCWQTYEMPNQVIVRSVSSDGKGKIYTGGFGDFGYWQYDKSSDYTYHSLRHLVKDKSTLNNEIWKIHVDGDRVLFQSFANIFIYQNGKIEIIEAEDSFLFLFKVGNRFFIEASGKGLFELKGNKLVPIYNSYEVGVKSVLSILPFKEGSFIIGTAKNNLFIYDGSTIRPWKTQADSFFKTYQLNNGVLVSDNFFAYGTILNGIIILDRNGNIVQHINKSNGLQNNTVLSLFTDNLQNLWAGLDNGIDRIELNSSLYFYNDKNGLFGTVYSSIIFGDKIYLGTNQGLYQSKWENDPDRRQTFNFKLIPGSQGQVWDLSSFNGSLICGHNNGTFLVSDDSLIKISSISGGWAIKQLNQNSDKLIQGTYNGIVVYKKTTQGYALSHQVSGFKEPCRYLEQDINGNIWVSHPYKGLSKLKLSADQKKVVSLERYDESAGLPSIYGVHLYTLNGRIIFTSKKGFYTYDEVSNRFIVYNTLNNKLGTFSSSNKVISAGDNSYWFINEGRVALTNFEKPGDLKVDSGKFTVLNGKMVNDYENISKINANLFLISVDDGFVIFNRKHPMPLVDKLPCVFIGKIENIATEISNIVASGTHSNGIRVKHSLNSIRLNYSLPYYQQGDILYRYWLSGYSSGWSAWTSATQKDYTNLPHGNYTFKVQAKTRDGRVSSVSDLNIRILPPWYATLWAWLIYILLLIALCYLIRAWYRLKLKKHNDEISERLRIEQAEIIRQESILNEQKLISLRNEKLQSQIESKSREVTNSAMNMVYKNELLQNLRDEVSGLKDSQGKKLAPEQLKRLQKIIDESMNDERDWNLFESSFNETHENFFKKLKADHSELVPNDLKLCAYLRMNMSSKEIASLLNITVRGVEIRRYRLRKKLNIPHDKNLNEFLIEV